MSRHLLTKTICIAALVASCLFVIPPVYGQQGDTQVPVPSLDVLILVDESETMWSYTDPTGKRVQAVNLFIDQLSVSTWPGGKHRVGIIAFGTEPKVIPWTFLDSKEDAERIKQEYQQVHDVFGRSGYGDVNKALAKALEIMKAEHDPGRRPALVLISDGQPTRPSPPVNEEQGWDVVYAYLQETRQIVDEFKAVSYSGSFCSADGGTPLFTLLMGTDALLQEDRSTPEFIELYKLFWQESSSSTNGYFEMVTPLDEVGSVVMEVLTRLLCGIIYSTETEVENVREFQFTVGEELFQIFFAISGKDNPAISSKVFRPGQENPVQPDGETIMWRSDADYEIWSVRRSEPWAGTWRVVLGGGGNTYFSYVLFSSFSIEVQQPSHGTALPTGRPIEIKAQVIRKGEQPAAVTVRDFKVSITKPDGIEEQLSLKEQNGVYVGRFDDTDQEGEYGLAFNTTLQDGTKVYEMTKVELVPKPWLEYVDPAQDLTYESDKPIPLRACVHLAGGVSPLDVELKATLWRGGEIVSEAGLHCMVTGESNVLTCSEQFHPGYDPGVYAVDMTLESTLPPGIPVYDHYVVPIAIVSPTATLPPALPPTVTPTSMPSPAPPMLTAADTPSVTHTASPTAVPTDTPTLPPTATPTATPTRLQALLSTVLSNPSQCLIGTLAIIVVSVSLLLLALAGRLQVEKARDRRAARARQAIERKFNPYIAGVPVREPDMFFGREETLAKVLDTIHNNHIAIYGERRIGKTSLLHQLDNRLREVEDLQYLFIPAFVNLQGVPAERLFYTLMSAIARSYQPRVGPLDLICATKKKGYDDYDLVDDLEAVLEALAVTTDKQIRLVLLLDEGDELNKYDPKAQARLRGIFMTRAGRYLRMVWSGLSIDKEWKLSTSPWYNLFIETYLAPFTREEAIHLIQEPVKGIYRYDKNAIELILQYSERKPFRIQQICLATISHVLAQKRRRVTGPIRVTKEDVERAYQGLVAEEATSREMEEQGKVGLLEKRVAEGRAEYQVNRKGQDD